VAEKFNKEGFKAKVRTTKKGNKTGGGLSIKTLFTEY